MLSISIPFLLIFQTALSAAKSTPPKATISKEQCETREMAERFIPPRNQGHTGYCYAFAAADLLGEELNVMPPAAISGFNLLASYNAMGADDVANARSVVSYENKPKSLESVDRYAKMYYLREPKMAGQPLELRSGGFADLALSRIVQEGSVCKEDDLPTEIRSIQGDAQFAILKRPINSVSRDEKRANQPKEFLESLLQGEFVIQRMQTISGINNLKPVIDDEGRSAQGPLMKCIGTSEETFKFEPVRRLLPAVQDWAAVKVHDYVRNSCKNQIPVPKLNVHTGFFHAPNHADQAMRHMNTLLEKNKAFIINYDPCVLKGSCRGRSFPQHASVVTGRKWNETKKRCEIQIRNSYGTECEPKSADVDCTKGYWWVSMDAIAQNAVEVIHLSRP